MKYVLFPLAIVICLGTGWFVYQWSLAEAKQQRPKEATLPLAVEVSRVQVRPVVERIELVGGLEANADVKIRSQIRGYIRRLPVDVGDAVQGPSAAEQAALLVEIDDATSQQSISWAAAAQRVAEAQLKAQQAKQLLAQRTAERQLELARSGAVTIQARDEAEAQVAIAQAEVELEQARVVQAQADLQRSRLALQETRIVAPLSGHVAERYVEVGDLANPDDLLMRIVDISVVRTMVHVVEKDYYRVEIGQVSTIHVDSLPGRAFVGKVIRKAPVLDPDTRTAPIHIEIPNHELLLKPGMHARVSIVFNERRDVPVVPVASLVQRDGKSALFVVSGDPPTTSMQWVETGVNDNGYVEILSGLRTNDLVVTLGGRLLENGQIVTPLELPEQEIIADAGLRSPSAE